MLEKKAGHPRPSSGRPNCLCEKLGGGRREIGGEGAQKATARVSSKRKKFERKNPKHLLKEKIRITAEGRLQAAKKEKSFIPQGRRTSKEAGCSSKRAAETASK